MKLPNLLTFFALVLFIGRRGYAAAAPASDLPHIIHESDSNDCGVPPLVAFCVTKFPLENLDDSDGALEVFILHKELADLPLEECVVGDFAEVTLTDCVTALEKYSHDDDSDPNGLSLVTEERFFKKAFKKIKKILQKIKERSRTALKKSSSSWKG